MHSRKNNLQMRTPNRTNSTATNLSAESDAKAKILAICFVGFTAMLLAVAGAMSFFFAPDRSKDVWVSVGPILTGAISGLLGFWAGAAKRRA
jgi:hypothetical protein